ncbi:MAG: hypothetical protein AAF988_08265 [Pseudomonadota bacterium]
MSILSEIGKGLLTQVHGFAGNDYKFSEGVFELARARIERRLNSAIKRSEKGQFMGETGEKNLTTGTGILFWHGTHPRDDKMKQQFSRAMEGLAEKAQKSGLTLELETSAASDLGVHGVFPPQLKYQIMTAA